MGWFRSRRCILAGRSGSDRHRDDLQRSLEVRLLVVWSPLHLLLRLLLRLLLLLLRLLLLLGFLRFHLEESLLEWEGGHQWRLM